MENEASVVIGGKAGDGVRAAGNVLGSIFNRHGLYTFVREDYQSLIRGGHNYSQIRASKNKIRSQIPTADVVAAIDMRSIENHEERLGKDGRLLYDPEDVDYESEKACEIPWGQMVEDVGGIEIMRNSVAIGAIAYLYDLDMEIVKEVMEDTYGDKAEKNVVLADKGYEYSEDNFDRIRTMEGTDREDIPILTGNKAIALGAAKAGLQTYIAYPMTPSTSILHFTASYRDELDITVVQPENEIGVINMALGSAYAGARTMVATSGGGYALMQETVSLAGMSESPILIVNCQRSGPSTGVPTYTSQADLEFTINSAHGEFPRIVLAPGDPSEAFYRTGEALNLAWKFQVPVILLSDKHLSESPMTSAIDPQEVSPEEPKLADEAGEEYKRYKITEDGVSPLSFPGEEDKMIKATSYEHIESGYTTEDPDEVENMQDKRSRKYISIREEVMKRDPVKVHGDESSNNLILAWGSTKGAVLDAMDLMDISVKFVQPIYLEPFPSDEVLQEMDSADKTVCVETNATGQLAEVVKKETLRDVDEKILKYDMRPFNPLDLSKKLEEVFE
ncbi:MAG: 2-oxoacid:acceptor oxidoreductase subunit alpha [Candidatus Hadarchaeota archaeon]